MARHPVTVRIDDAVSLLQRYGQPLTIDNIVTNAKQKLTYSDFSSEEACEAMIRLRAPGRLKALGLSIVDSETYAREEFEECTDEQFAERIEVKERNVRHVQRHLAADRAVAEFLAAKHEQHGRPVTVGEFLSEIDAIYAEHGVAA